MEQKMISDYLVSLLDSRVYRGIGGSILYVM